MRLLILILGLCLSVGLVSAQTFGEITGEVKDPSGAVAPNAQVTATNTATNATRSTATNDAGIYSFPALVPGFYSVKVEASGFQAIVRTNIELQVQQTARVDFTLAVGQTTQAIEVSGSAELLTTESATVGTVIATKTIDDLPLNGRDFLQLIALSTNVTAGFSPPAQDAGRQGGSRVNENYSISGMRGTWNNYTLDGIADTDPNFNLYIQLPSVDALQEFKVQSGVYPAEFGREAAQINVSTKPGGNAFHGTAYEFLRNDALDAEDYNFTSVARPKNPYRQNQFGFTLGGPVWIPKVFNGKDKLFFMSNFEVFTSRKTTDVLYTVAPTAWRTGDFSSLLPNVQLFNPYSRATANGVTTAAAFPNNQIPVGLLDPTSLKLLQYLPSPNLTTATLSNNYVDPQKTPLDKTQFNQRIDFNQSPNSQWFGRFGWTDENTLTPSLPLQGTSLHTTSQQYMISNTRVISPTKVNELHAGYTTFGNALGQELGGVTNVDAALGLPVTLSNPLSWGVPGVAGFAGGLTAWGNSNNGPYVVNDKIGQIVENFSWVHGKHSIRFGGEYRYDVYNQYGNEFSRAQFTFTGPASNSVAYTANPAVPFTGNNTGNLFADFMVGAIGRTDLAAALASADFRASSFAAYIDDTYKVTSKLTVTLGLRYEVVQPWLDDYGNEINIQLKQALPDVANVADPSVHPVMVRAGSGSFYQGASFVFSNPNVQVARDGRMGARLINTDWKDFAPRFGIAWSPTSKWSVRTGFGVFYSQDSGNSRFDLERTLSGDAVDTNTNISAPPQVSYHNFFSTAILPVPVPSMGLTWGVDPNVGTPYSMTYLLNVERQLGKNTLEVGYTGTQSRKLQNLVNANAPVPGTTAAPSRQPYPEFATGIEYVEGQGFANYNALSAKLSRRYSSGLTALISYTWSRSMDNGSAIRGTNGDQFAENSRCLQCEYGPSGFDTAHRFVTSLLYELPVGKGKALAVNNRFLNAVVGGWQMTAIFTARTGFPLDPTGWDAAGQILGSNRLNATGISPNLPSDQRTLQKWFNVAAFTPAAPGTFGTAGRNSIRGPSVWNLDLAALKNFRITESQSLQLRYETFNTPNHPEWGNPNMSAWSSSSPTAPGPFASITTTATPMRQMQFALKYIF